MKPGVRVIGIDDSPFTRRSKKILVMGVVYREGIVEGILSTRVEKDGRDSTEKLITMIKRSRFFQQLRAVLLNSITLAGFNIVDIQRLSAELNLPVIAISRKKPSKEKVRKALANLKDGSEKILLVEKAGSIFKERAYLQIAGTDIKPAREILSRFSAIPEPIRLAHIIGSGVVRGESSGRI